MGHYKNTKSSKNIKTIPRRPSLKLGTNSPFSKRAVGSFLFMKVAQMINVIIAWITYLCHTKIVSNVVSPTHYTSYRTRPRTHFLSYLVKSSFIKLLTRCSMEIIPPLFVLASAQHTNASTK